MYSNDNDYSIELREYFNKIKDGEDIGLAEKKIIMKISTIIHLAIMDELIGDYTTREEIYQLLVKSNLDYEKFSELWVEKSNHFTPLDTEDTSIEKIEGIHAWGYAL